MLIYCCLVADDEYRVPTPHDDHTINEVPHDEHDDQDRDYDSLAYGDYGDGESGDGGDDVDLIDLELTGDLQRDFDALTSSLAQHLKRTGNNNFDDIDIRELLETKGELPPVVKSLTPPATPTTTVTTAPAKSASGGGGIKFDRFLNFGHSASSRAGAQNAPTTATRKNASWHGQNDEVGEEDSDPSQSVTLCKLMNICDAPKKGNKNKNKRPKAYFGDTIAMGSETHRSIVDPPTDLLRRLTRKRRKRRKLNLRTGEKTAVEVAQLLSGGGLEMAASTKGEVDFSSKVSEGALGIPTSDRSSASSELQGASVALEPYSTGEGVDMKVAEGRVRKTLVESEDEYAADEGVLQHMDETEFTVGEHNIDRDDSSWTPVLFQSPLLDTSTSSSSQSLSDSEDGWKPIGEPVTKQRD